MFTFSFTYIGVSVHRNFVHLPVSVASPLNNITLILSRYIFLVRNFHVQNKIIYTIPEQNGLEVVVLLTDNILSKCTFVHRQLSLSQIDGYFISLLSFQTIARWSVPFRDFSGMAGKVDFFIRSYFRM